MMNYPNTASSFEAGVAMKFVSTKGFEFLLTEKKFDTNGNALYTIVPIDSTFSKESLSALYSDKKISIHTFRRYQSKGFMTVQNPNIAYAIDNIFGIIHADSEKFYK